MATQALSPANQTLVRRLYRSRWLIWELVSRDLRLRYRGSVLGFAWTFLNPLLFMGVYVVVFGMYLRMSFHNYALFLLSGTLAFNWFSSAVQAGTTCVPDGRHYIGKTIFPAEVLIAVPVLSNFVNFLLSLPVLILADLIFHQPLGLPIIILPVLMFAQIMITAGTLFFFATFNVFYRDFQQLVMYFVTVLFYLIPIFYRIDTVPAQYQPYVLANPFAALITGYQDVLFFNTMPSAKELAIALAFGSAVLITGYLYFGRFKEAFGEYV